MKKIVLSFDDGRLDTYTNACRILDKYGMKCTINVVTDFVINEDKYDCFNSADNKSMSVKQICEAEKNGIEIACHGHTHKNSKEDVLANIEALNQMGVDTSAIGFASPNSEITEENTRGVGDLLDENILLYIRSGIQVRREGLFYALLSFIERKIHSKHLFYLLNKRNIISKKGKKILPSVAIKKHTTIKQIAYLLAKMKDGESVIFMFHSVLGKNEHGYGVDGWYFDIEKFEQMCELLNNPDISVCTTRELVSSLE